jgi:MFS transporter, FHS family, L-fucose permease
MEKTIKPTNYGALSTLTTVFFFWGFIAAGNSIFIPFCKHYFHLDQFQSQLIDFAFYGAYYLGALGLFLFSTASGRDLVGSWGYKRSIVYGLLFSAIGAVAMIVSVYLNVFAGMLFGLFIVALGFSLQQTSANPFMISLGDESTGSNRINLGGSINSLGTSIGPVIISLALFGTAAAVDDKMIQALSLSKIIILYSAVGCLFLGVAALFGFSKRVPDGKTTDVASASNDEVIDNAVAEKAGSAKKAVVTLLIITGLLIACFAPVFNSYRTDEAKQLVELNHDLELVSLDEQGVELAELSTAQLETKSAIQQEIDTIQKPLNRMRILCWTGGLVAVVAGILFAYGRGSRQKEAWGAMQFPQLTLGMLAIFVYVGVEVAIGSNLSELLKQPAFGGYESSETTPFVSMFWGSLMIGRWAGSINAFKLASQTKMILRFIVPLIAFGVVLGFVKLNGYNIDPLYWYIICVLMQIVAFYLTKDKPALTLTVFGILGVGATLVGLATTGIVSIYAFLSAGLFCSIMWPCIFSLSLAGLGKYQSQGSAFLVMMILGGAIIPPLQGKLSDIIGIQTSFVVGTICFLYITFFAVFVNRLLKKQGVSLDDAAGGH